MSSSRDSILIRDDTDNLGISINIHSSLNRALITACDGKYLLAGSNVHSIHVWEIRSDNNIRIRRKPDYTLSGHSGDINALSCSDPNNYLISASDDKNIIIWELNSWKK